VAFIRSPSPELLLRREMTLQGLTVERYVVRERQPYAVQGLFGIGYFRR
jgi:hypothetical protein